MIHLNIGSNLDSKHGTKFDNISIALTLLVESRVKIKKVSNFYETPSYPNRNFPKFINIGLTIDFKNEYLDLFKKNQAKHGISQPFHMKTKRRSKRCMVFFSLARGC